MQNRAPRVQTDTASSLFSPRSSSPSSFNDSNAPQISIGYAIQRTQCHVCLSIHCLSGTVPKHHSTWPGCQLPTSHSLIYQKFPIPVTSDTPRWVWRIRQRRSPPRGPPQVRLLTCRPPPHQSAESQTRPPALHGRHRWPWCYPWNELRQPQIKYLRRKPGAQ